MTLLYPRERVIECVVDGASHLLVLEAIILVPYLSSCALDRFRLPGVPLQERPPHQSTRARGSFAVIGRWAALVGVPH